MTEINSRIRIINACSEVFKSFLPYRSENHHDYSELVETRLLQVTLAQKAETSNTARLNEFLFAFYLRFAQDNFGLFIGVKRNRGKRAWHPTFAETFLAAV